MTLLSSSHISAEEITTTSETKIPTTTTTTTATTTSLSSDAKCFYDEFRSKVNEDPSRTIPIVEAQVSYASYQCRQKTHNHHDHGHNNIELKTFLLVPGYPVSFKFRSSYPTPNDAHAFPKDEEDRELTLLLTGHRGQPPRIYAAVVYKGESRYIGRYGRLLARRGRATTVRAITDGECGTVDEPVAGKFELTSRHSSLWDLDEQHQPIQREKRWDLITVQTKWLKEEYEARWNELV